MLTFKTIFKINYSYLLSCEKLESYKGRKGDVVVLAEMPHGSFFNGADILILEQVFARFQMLAEKEKPANYFAFRIIHLMLQYIFLKEII